MTTKKQGCDPEIFSNGEYVCIVSGKKTNIEKWVSSIAKKARAKIGWHWRLDGCEEAYIRHLGDRDSLIRVVMAIDATKDQLKGKFLAMEKLDLGIQV